MRQQLDELGGYSLTSVPHRVQRLTRTQWLSDAYVGRQNSFGLLRLVFAVAVLVNHSMILGYGRAITDRVDIASLAVSGFFVVSGFLITRSAQTTNLPRYLWHRALRIMPGLWTCLIFTALIVAPALFWLDHRSFDTLWRSDGGVINYLKLNAITGARQFGIADVAADTPYGVAAGGSVLNGSLWTLVYEMVCYVAVGALAFVGVLKRGRWLVLAALVAACGLILWNTDFNGTIWAVAFDGVGPFPFIGYLIKPLLLWFGAMFLVGAVAALFADRIPINDAFGAGAVVIVAALIGVGHWSSPAAVAFGYVILWAAVRLPSSVHWIGQRNDYSYGVYIYAFLVQQVLATFGVHRAGFIGYTAATLVVTAALAYASWHLVEKHALRLKRWSPPWLPGRTPKHAPEPAIGPALADQRPGTSLPGQRAEPDPTPVTS